MSNAPISIALKNVPAKASNIESILDIILQVLNVFEAVLRIFGIELNFGK